MDAATYRKATGAALGCTAAIILTGAAVRLSGSGLGCSDWPNCEPGAFVSAASSHQAIEQINRLFTFVMAIAIAVAISGALVRRPRRPDLTTLAVGLMVAFFGQGVVGGIVVLTHLHPAAVMGHFLLSAVMLAAAVVLHHRAGEPPGPYVAAVSAGSLNAVRALAVAGAVAVVTGTLVTNTGPHSGDAEKEIRRFGWQITSIARVHSIAVLVTLALAAALAVKLRGSADWGQLATKLEWFLFAGLAQGAIGYWQYFTRLPVGLVAVHVAGATIVVWTLTRLVLATRHAVGDPARDPTTSLRPAVPAGSG